jgi:subtilase family serine protease
MGLLALAGCGREDVPAEAAPLRSTPAALESGPDLAVTQVRGPASVWHGQGFTATVRVCNQGTGPAYSLPRVELFLSTDDTLTLPDPGTPPGPSGDQVSIGFADLSQFLQPGQCENRSVSANAILPPAATGDGAYYLAAAIDTTHQETEAREDNNVLVSGLMGVGSRSDLVVTEVSAPANVRHGQDFKATVKVCNQGTSPTSEGSSSPYDRPRLELFLSMDTELTLPDPAHPSPMDQSAIGYVDLNQTLYPGQCVKKDVHAAPTPPPAATGDGAYYLVAAIDTRRLQQELREDNNVHVSGLMGVGERPDLVVTEVGGPASVRPWQSFTASVKVCNQGTAPTTSSYSGAQVDLFLSTDATVAMPAPGQPPDLMPITSVNLDQTLFPGQCVTKRVMTSAGLPPESTGDGAYYLAAAVDTAHQEQELREDNNVRVGGLMGMGHRSDLVVTQVKGPSSMRPGQNFLATVTVCNQGTSPTNSYYPRARLELYLSMDAELTLPDPYMPSPGMPMDQQVIGELELDALQEGQCVTKDVSGYPMLPPAAQGDGAYYLAAAIDINHAEQELREDNNVLVSGLVGVGHRPDLVVTEVSAPPSARPGQGFMASVKVCNQGTSSSSGYPSYSNPRVELFLSTEAGLTLPDPSMPSPGPLMNAVSLGYVKLDHPLQAGQCVTENVPASAHPPPSAQQPDGTYYLVAAVDPAHEDPELREDNNVHVAGLMAVGHRADLVVSALSGPTSVRPGHGFMVTAKVCNQGSSASYGSSRLEFFLSMDAELTLPQPSMPYPGPVEDQRSIGYLELYQSLQPGQCVTKSVPVYADPPPAAQQPDGTYYLAAAIDTHHAEQELREDNNVRVGGLLGVGHRSDLVVTELSGPASVRPGHGFMATVKVCNQGTSSSSGYPYYGSPRLELFLSTDTELTLPEPSMPYPGMPEDQISIGYVELDALQAGQCVTKSVPANATPPPAATGEGTYYLAAVADSRHMEQELREDNNVRVSGPVGVGHRSDLVVTEVSAPANLGHGQNFTASVKVCNQGTSPTSSASYYGPRVELFLSMDTELTLPHPSMPYPGPVDDQRSIGDVELNESLAPGQCVTKHVSAHASLPPAAQMDSAHYLVAAVDTNHAEQELREDNNVLVSGLVGVGYRPDLVVTGLSAPVSVRPDQVFTASVKVCNQGTSSSYSMTNVDLFLSMDTELTLPDPSMPYPGMPEDQRLLESVNLDQSLAPGQCVTRSIRAPPYPPPEAQMDSAYYLIAAVDTNHLEQELREDNNIFVGGLLGVGYRSDLVVTELSGPESLRPGESVTATVKVCNQGAGPTSGFSYGPRLELFLSTDTELTLPDPSSPYPGMPMDQAPIGYVELSQSLAAGQCVTKSVNGSAWLPEAAQGEGAYYLAAAIDTTNMEQELREDNNVRVSGLVGVGYRTDLVVTGVSTPPNLMHGQSFTASVKVCNQGTVSTGNSYYGAQVELFLSMDTTLTLPEPYSPYPGTPMDQVSIGSVELDQPLSPGRCVTKNVPASAALPPAAQGDGAYYLVAAVDTQHAEQELREDNNVLVSGLVGVGSRPDLVVSEVSAPSSLGHGQSFTASVKVCNQGTTPAHSGSSSYGPRVELFLSMDTELTLPHPSMPPSPAMPTDQQSLGYVELNQPLYPGQCVTKNVPASAALPPQAQGDMAYYLVAAVDTAHAEQELREDNNVLVSGLVGVGYRPDLVVTAVSGPASIAPGQGFTASVDVCNQGTQSSMGSSRLELFLSMDTEVTPPELSMPSPGLEREQMPIGFVDLNQPLAPGQCVTKSVPASAQLPQDAPIDSALYLAAIIDTGRMELELREDNNVFVGGLMGVGHRPDLVVTGVSAPASAGQGESFTASVTVCNQGLSPTYSGSSYGPSVELFLSTDTELTLPSWSNPHAGMESDQMSIGYVELEQALPPGQCVTRSVSASAHLPPEALGDGAYYLVAAVDTNHADQELREDNNVLVKGLMGVGHRPDLVVTEVSAPASLHHGQSFTTSVKVCNQGTAASMDTAWLMVVLSTDAQLSLPNPSGPPPADQMMIGGIDVAPLPAGQCVTKDIPAYASLPAGASAPGVFHLGAIIDANRWVQELREDNNIRAGNTLEVTD